MTSTFSFSQLVRAQSNFELLKARVVRAYERGALVSLGSQLAVLKGYAAAKAGQYKKDEEIAVYIIGADENSHKVFVTDKNIWKQKKKFSKQISIRTSPK